MKRWRNVALALALLVGSVVPAFAQFDRGSISGTIKDEQGGVMPGVTVTVTNTQTQQAQTTITNGTGFYTFPNLLPGRYDIIAELTGFKKTSRQNVPLDAAGSINLDFALQTGTISEEVTVAAVSPPLQTDVALRKTVEAKDIELMSFSGRNPIGVVGLKAGVMGGNFNSRGFSDLGNGGYNINGSRTDENNITIDGATAVRTRASGAIVGIQNVDAIQEVQVLTGNYMPEFGRASGGQIRFVTKSGSSRYSGSGSYFLRDDKLQANTWARNRSPNAIENSGAAPFDYKQYGYSFGGPIPGSMFKDRLFFFAAQEWVNYLAVQTNSATVPTEAMRRGDFSELLNPANRFFGRAITLTNPLTGQPFANNVIPASQLSANGMALLNAYPLPTPGYQQGTNNAIFNSENPQDQRKDNIRFDYRLNNTNQLTFRYSKYSWVAIDAFRGTFPYARTDWDRPNSTQTFSWTSTLRSNLINEATYTHSLDQVFINVFTGTELYKRSRTGINYRYIFPDFKEIPDKIESQLVSPWLGRKDSDHWVDVLYDFAHEIGATTIRRLLRAHGLALTLLWSVNPFQGGEHLPGDVSLQAPDDLPLRQPFLRPANHVLLGPAVPAHPRDGDPPQRVVRLTVAAAVQPVPGGEPGGGRQGCRTAQAGETRLTAQPLRVVSYRDQQRAGHLDPHPVDGQQARRGERDQCPEVVVELGDLSAERCVTASQVA
jgi:hypothetical protein